MCFPDGQLDEEGSRNHPDGEPSFWGTALAPPARGARGGPLAQRVMTKAWWRHRPLLVRPMVVEH